MNITLQNIICWIALFYTINKHLGSGTPAGHNRVRGALISREKQTEYERKHFEDYKINAGLYRIWPEINKNNPEKCCQLLISSLFPSAKSGTITDCLFLSAYLIYRELNDYEVEVNPERDFQSSAKVLTLECKLLRRLKRRHYMHFIRSPRFNHVYAVKRLNSNTKFQFIIESEVYIINDEEKSSSKKRFIAEPRYYDDPEKRLKYERQHFKDYLLNRDAYLRWTELDKMQDKDGYCRNLIEKVCPRTNLSGVYGVLNRDYLKYTIREDVEPKFNNVHVAVINCYIQRRNHGTYKFIRAPNPSCVYLVRRITKYYRMLNIASQICGNEDDNDEEVAGNKGEPPGEATTEFSNNMDLTDFPINDM